MKFKEFLKCKYNIDIKGINIHDYLLMRNIFREYTIKKYIKYLLVRGTIDNNGEIRKNNNPFSRIINHLQQTNTTDIIDSDDFIIVKKLYRNEINKPSTDIIENRPYSLLILKNPTWSLGNILTFGMDSNYSLEYCIELLKDIRIIAKKYVKKYEYKYNWDLDTVRFYFHIHPRNSIATLHLHIIDITKLYDDYLYNLERGILLDDAITALQMEARSYVK